nr:reverse transcriptase domain-containing protein [Tanacetum cinerariifolium]
MGSKFMASGEECLDGWVGAGRGEVKGGGVDFGVSRILLGEILREIIGESGGGKFLELLENRYIDTLNMMSGNEYHQKDKIKAKSDKTEHEMKGMEKSKVNQKSTQSKSKMEPRSRVDPTLLNDFKMDGVDQFPDGNGDLPVPDLRTMEELCQPTLSGRGGPISPIAIQATNFRLKNDMTQQVQLLPVSWTFGHRDTINAAAGGTFIKRRPEECYDLIENMTAHQNDRDTSVQRSESSSSITSSSDPEILALKAEMAEINKNLLKVL